jgi:hypothetical protein
MEKNVKIAAAVFALIATIAGGLYAFDVTYLRCAVFAQHEAKHIKAEMFENQKLIWAYQDRANKTSDPREKAALMERIRELEYQNRILMEQMKRQGG